MTLSKNPSVMISVIKKHMQLHNTHSYDSVVKIIVNSMYENVVDDHIYNKDILKILDGVANLLI